MNADKTFNCFLVFHSPKYSACIRVYPRFQLKILNKASTK